MPYLLFLECREIDDEAMRKIACAALISWGIVHVIFFKRGIRLTDAEKGYKRYGAPPRTKFHLENTHRISRS